LEDQHGNKLVMDAEGIALSSASDVILQAQGDLNADGLNIEMKSSTAFKADGGGSADLTSNGTLKVKGSLVQIN
jgi:hypothetical protein